MRGQFQEVCFTMQRGLRTLLLVTILTPAAFHAGAQVSPVDWAAFKRENPSDSLSLIAREILLNANRYALTTWYRDIKHFDRQDRGYLELDGIGEHNIRAIGSEAFALAVSLRTGIYDPEHTGVSSQEALRIAVSLVLAQ